MPTLTRQRPAFPVAPKIITFMMISLRDSHFFFEWFIKNQITSSLKTTDYKLPLVEGISCRRSSFFTASANALATPLKTASII